MTSHLATLYSICQTLAHSLNLSKSLCRLPVSSALFALHTCACVHTHWCACTCVRMHVYVCACVHTCVCMCSYVCTYTCACVCTCMFVCWVDCCVCGFLSCMLSGRGCGVRVPVGGGQDWYKHVPQGQERLWFEWVGCSVALWAWTWEWPAHAASLSLARSQVWLELLNAKTSIEVGHRRVSCEWLL